MIGHIYNFLGKRRKKLPRGEDNRILPQNHVLTLINICFLQLLSTDHKVSDNSVGKRKIVPFVKFVYFLVSHIFGTFFSL